MMKGLKCNESSDIYFLLFKISKVLTKKKKKISKVSRKKIAEQPRHFNVRFTKKRKKKPTRLAPHDVVLLLS